jgi:hypothetical protein
MIFEISLVTLPEIAATKNVCMIMNAASLMNIDGSRREPDIGNSSIVTASKMIGNKELNTTTKSGANCSRRGSKKGAASMASATQENCSFNPSTEDREAKNAIGIVCRETCCVKLGAERYLVNERSSGSGAANVSLINWTYPKQTDGRSQTVTGKLPQL